MCKEHEPLKWRSKFFKFYVRIYLYWSHRPWPRCNNRELNNKCLLFITLSTWYFLLAWNPGQYIEIWNILNAKKDRYDVRFMTKMTISHFLQISTNCPWYELVEWPNTTRTSETSKLLRSCRGECVGASHDYRFRNKNKLFPKWIRNGGADDGSAESKARIVFEDSKATDRLGTGGREKIARVRFPRDFRSWQKINAHPLR